LKHLIGLLEELTALGIAFVSLNEGIDATTPAGKLQMHILGAIAEFERGRITERVRAGLQRARAQGKRLGRPRKARAAIVVPGGSVRDAARIWGVSKSTAARWISAGRPVGGTNVPDSLSAFAPDSLGASLTV
jgi:DNA invertase Pin-like site-specific DNA recombinase